MFLKRITSELTGRRDSFNLRRTNVDAKHATAAPVQRVVRLRLLVSVGLRSNFAIANKKQHADATTSFVAHANLDAVVSTI